ncbi:MAG: hypothetical protein ABJG78_10750 [Cyclobacteriaceae bacterium]
MMMNRINQYGNTKIYVSLLLLISCVLFYAPTPAYGQKQSRTRLKAYYEKLPNNDKKISIILTQGKGKKTRGVSDAEIFLTTFDADSAMELATLSTDSLGEAVLFIEANYTFPKNEDGYSVIDLKYPGNDSLRSAKKKIEFLDLNIDLTLDIIDSVKYVEVLTYEIASDGNRTPISEVGINFGVERLYSTLYLEEVDTDDDGVAIMEFPNDIPGDSIGMITVVVMLEDHDDYGTVTKSSDISWGTPVDYSIVSNGRSLFGDSAPLWMIISVAVILSGAWFNFLLAVYKVYRIKKLA